MMWLHLALLHCLWQYFDLIDMKPIAPKKEQNTKWKLVTCGHLKSRCQLIGASLCCSCQYSRADHPPGGQWSNRGQFAFYNDFCEGCAAHFKQVHVAHTVQCTHRAADDCELTVGTTCCQCLDATVRTYGQADLGPNAWYRNYCPTCAKRLEHEFMAKKIRREFVLWIENPRESAMANLASSETYVRTALDGMRIMGGWGYLSAPAPPRALAMQQGREEIFIHED